MAKDLAELQDEVVVRGYTHDFSFEGKSLRVNETGESLSLRELRVVESVILDGGTDPGDDVTMYLIESSGGQKGYLILSDSFHVDPQKAAFIDALLAQSRCKG